MINQKKKTTIITCTSFRFKTLYSIQFNNKNNINHFFIRKKKTIYSVRLLPQLLRE